MKIAGIVTFTIIKENGEKRIIKCKNLITAWGLERVVNTISGAPFDFTTINNFAIGTGQTPPELTDSSLETETNRNTATITKLNPTTVRFTVQHAKGAIVGTFYEAGLFDAPTNGNLFNRTVFPELILTANDTLIQEWDIIVSNIQA